MSETSPIMLGMSPSQLASRYSWSNLELEPCMDPQIPVEYRFERTFVEPIIPHEFHDPESQVVLPGQTIGNEEVLFDRRMKNNVLAKTDCVCLFILRDAYKNIVEVMRRSQNDKKHDFIASQILGDKLSKPIGMILSSPFKKMKYLRFQNIYDIGDDTRLIYFIKKGTVMISTNLYINDVSSTKGLRDTHLKTLTFKLAEVGNMESLGLENMIIPVNERVYKARVVSQTCTVYEANIDRIKGYCKDYPYL
jgi:CRP-like cAMP-binding protein